MKLWSGIVTEKVRASKEFYLRLFDFNVLYEGEDDWFVLLELDGGELGLMQPGLESQAPIFRRPYAGAGLWITIDVDDVQAEHARIAGLGIPILQPIREEPWGDVHFVVADPNGVGIDIVQRRAQPSRARTRMLPGMPPYLDIDQAAATLRQGGVIAYPTEAVWGLGCDPLDEAAVRRLLAIKQRDVAKGLILIAGSEAQLMRFIAMDALTSAQGDQVRASWPGPNTWIVPAALDAPRWITGDHDGIAVRVTAHAQVIALCDAFGSALVSTSANLSGQPAAHTQAQLDPQLLAQIDGVLHGETGGLAQPSIIRDARSGTVLRG